MGLALLVVAGQVPQQEPFLHEVLFAELTAEGLLASLGVACACPGWFNCRGFATEEALDGLLSHVCAHMHVEMGLWVKLWLQNSHSPLIAALSFNLHLQGHFGLTPGAQNSLHTDNFSASPYMHESLAQQVSIGRELFGTGGTGLGSAASVQLDSVAQQTFLSHEVLGAGRTLVGHLPGVRHHVHDPLAEGLLAHLKHVETCSQWFLQFLTSCSKKSSL